MALLSRRTRKAARKATRKAEAKALLHKAGLEAKLGAKNERKQLGKIAKNERKHLSTLAKNDKKALESAQKVEKAQIRAFEAQAKAAREGKISAAKVRKYIGIARVAAPVLLPLAYRAATLVRAQLDQRRASSIGVSVDELTQYTGHGAKLSARIAGAEKSVAQIRAAKSDAETGKFSDAITERLSDLTTAVAAAEQMPPARRKIAHGAISGELDGIEADILARLGLR